MTSNEIKAYILGKLEERDPADLFFEFFKQIKETENPSAVKAIVSKWHWACAEIKKETNDLYGIDETFPKSIFCWNANRNISRAGHISVHYRNFQQAFGLDIKAIAEGKHCKLAQIIFDAITKAERASDDTEHYTKD
jgi:hypothetical protein